MASEIRVDKINSLSGVGTVTLSPTGVDIAGITTAATLRATTGIVTSLTAGSLTSLGAVSGTTGTFSGAVSGTTGTFSGAVSGTTGNFSSNVDVAGELTVAETIAHTGDTNNKISFPSADTITATTSGSERVRIISSGEVSIGGFTPTASAGVLQISGGLRVAGSASASDTTSPYIYRTSGSDHLNFATSGVERVRIQSGGYVNILTGGLTTTDDGAGSGTSSLELQPYGTDGYINCTASGNLYTRMGTGYTIRTRIDSSGNFHINSGNIVMSTSGKGIDFSAAGSDADSSGASTDTEVLDDYEEGSWTPLLKRLNSGVESGFYNQNTQNGQYTKIGNTVFIRGRIHWSGGSTGSGSTILVNLPFAAQNTGANETPLSIGYRSGWNYPRLAAYLEVNNGRRYRIQYVDASGTFGSFDITPSAAASSGHFYFSGQYQTTS